MKSSGFYFSADAVLAMLLLASLLALPVPRQSAGFWELLVLQKENDLLRQWAREGLPFNEAEIASDARFVFPDSAFSVTLDGKETLFGAKTGSAVASEIIFFDAWLRKHSIQLVVYK